MENKILIGSHVSMKAPDFYLGSVKEALSYGATSLMLYTGAPQNTVRTELSKLKIEEAFSLIKEANLDLSKFICHAPYLINLANSLSKEKIEMSINLLKNEMVRTRAMGIEVLVLHPGGHMTAGVDVGLDTLIKNLNFVLDNDQTGVKIAIETMAGKGSEVGTSLEQIAYVIKNIHKQEQIGVCLDTCHLNDAGYNIKDFDNLINQIKNTISIEKVLVIHINDSKNPIGAHKDRHENLGYGYVGFDAINAIVHSEIFKDIPKILETPYIGDKPPYQKEIEMLKNGVLIPNWKDSF
ncbi:MAG: deoxyribonuclease IV [Traorella sp.]